MTIEEFKYNVGEVIMYCQVIEHDIKVIYASMLNGDFDANYNALLKERATLGQAVVMLQELDFSDDDHFFTESEYDFLKKVTGIRNHWCHQGYTNFIYLDNYINSWQYKNEVRRLTDDHDKLNYLFIVVQKIKEKAMKQYGRR